MNSFADLRPLDMAEINSLRPSKPFPSSSSFYDDLNLDGCSKNDKFLSNFIANQNNSNNSNMIYLNQLTGDPSSSHDFFDLNLATNDSFNNVKKKKLTNYSISSSNLPSVTLSSAMYNDNHHANNSALSFTNDEDNFTRNLSNSSYGIASSGISASSSCNSNLSSYSQTNSNNSNNQNFTGSGQNYFFGKEDCENLILFQ